MIPQENTLKDQGQKEIDNLQEQFGNGLQDQSLPAALVLTQQEEARQKNERAPLPALERTSLGFIP